MVELGSIPVLLRPNSSVQATALVERPETSMHFVTPAKATMASFGPLKACSARPGDWKPVFKIYPKPSWTHPCCDMVKSHVSG
jgi:hypothetical protein